MVLFLISAFIINYHYNAPKVRDFLYSGSNLNRLPARYSSISSIPIQRRSSASATAPVVLEPAKGSSTMSSSLVSNFRKNSGSEAGNRAGWILVPTSLQRFVYASLLALFPIFRKSEGISSMTLGAIDPPAEISSNEELMLCPEGRTVVRTPL